MDSLVFPALVFDADRLDRAGNHGGVVGLHRVGMHLELVVVQQSGPNSLDLKISKALTNAGVATYDSKQ